MSGNNYVAVTEVMEEECLVVDGLSTVAEVLAKMVEKDVAFAFVEKRDEHDEYGIVLVSDIAKQVLAPHKSPDRINAYEVMTKPVLPVQPDMDIRYCARLFDQFGISTAPVIKAGEILGAVTYDHLVLKGLAQQK